MRILKHEPAGKVASAEELMAIAHAMEEEAARRYRDFAQHMRDQGETAVADLFSFLAQVEDKHAGQVDAHARTIIGKAPDPAHIRWDLPDYFDDNGSRSYLLTPYRALAIAVRNEERAFAFYSYLAAGAEDEEVRKLAESFAKEELEHAALLRRERRRAWREEDRSRIPQPAERQPSSLNALLREAGAMEAAAAHHHAALAESLRRAGDSETARLFEEAAADERDCAGSTESRLGIAVPAASMDGPPRTIFEGLQILEFVFERYNSIVERATDEAVMQEAQLLAERALSRLARVHGSVDSRLLKAAQGRKS